MDTVPPVTPEALTEMRRLATPEGAAELQSKIGPMTLDHGVLPFPDDKVSHDPVDPRPVEDRKVLEVSSIPGQKDGVLFSLAPVYYTIKIPFDIVSQFLNSEHGTGASVTRLKLPFELMPDVPGWADMLELIDVAHWDRFVLFLGECAFQRSKYVWTICGDMVYPVKASLPEVAIFTPRGLATRLVPYIDDAGYIRFESKEIVENLADSDFIRKLRNVEKGVRQ